MKFDNSTIPLWRRTSRWRTGLLGMAAGALLSLPSMAQNVQIGTGTGTGSALPIYSCYDYSYTQQIYTKAQINTAGNIEKIRFYYVSGATTNSDNWAIYMGHTAKTSFTSTTDWVAVGSLTSVFNGTVTYPAANNWMEITLTTPFPYNNVDNLIIAVDENKPG